MFTLIRYDLDVTDYGTSSTCTVLGRFAKLEGARHEMLRHYTEEAKTCKRRAQAHGWDEDGEWVAEGFAKGSSAMVSLTGSGYSTDFFIVKDGESASHSYDDCKPL